MADIKELTFEELNCLKSRLTMPGDEENEFVLNLKMKVDDSLERAIKFENLNNSWMMNPINLKKRVDEIISISLTNQSKTFKELIEVMTSIPLGERTRMLNVLKVQGIEVVSDLLPFTLYKIQVMRNMGKITLRNLGEILWELQDSK